jgi:putative toxin-antitoxin system antitoxin component (TIGR02293 family)
MNTSHILYYLGGEKALLRGKNGNDLLALIKTGLPAGTINKVVERTGVARAVLLKTLTISEGALARRSRTGKLTTLESDRLIRLARVYAHATEVFGGRDNAAEWMKRPLRALNFAAPLELLETEEGARRVETVLSHLEHGVFSL